MAIIFAEGFDQYGTVQYNATPGPGYGGLISDSTGRYNMLSGVWSEVPLSAKCYYEDSYNNGDYPFKPRTGKASLGFVTGTGSVHLRRTLFAQKTTVGCAFAVWMAQLPTDHDTQVLISFLDSKTYPNVGFILQPDGTIEAKVPVKWGGVTTNDWLGDLDNDYPYGATTIASSAVGAFTAGTWNHIEVKVVIGGGGVGQVSLRINERTDIGFGPVTANTIGTYSTGTYTSAPNDAYVSQVSFLYNQGQSYTNHLPIFLDDIVCWDNVDVPAGKVVIDWVGDKNVVLQPLAFDNSDGGIHAGLAAGWDVVGAVGIKEAIDDFNDPTIWVNDPYDDAVLYPTPFVNGRDTASYLVADTINETVELRTDVPATIEDIIAVIPVNSLRKTQASTTKVQVSMVDGGTPINGLDRPVAQDFTYYQDIFERDAAGNLWTPATLNAAFVRIKRTT